MLGDKIRQLRSDSGKSQVQLAKALDVTKQCVSNWENNNIQPSIDMLMKIAEHFSVSTDFLLGIDDRRYLDVTGLSDVQIFHLQQIINDINNK